MSRISTTVTIFLLAPLVVATACQSKSENAPTSDSKDASGSNSKEASGSNSKNASGSDSKNASAASSSSEAKSTAPSDAAPARPPRRTQEITKQAVAEVTSSSEQACHLASYAFDGWPTTSWTEDSAGDGTGEWLEASLQEGTFVDYIEVSGGWFTKRSNRLFDAWDKNNSFRVMEVKWDGGETTVEFNRVLDKGRRKRVPIGKVIKSVKLTAVSVDRGTYNDLCLDDIWIYGSLGNGKALGPKLCADPAPAECPDGLFMKMPSAPIPSKTKFLVETLGQDATLYGVEIAIDKNLGAGVVARNQCQADKISRMIGSEIGAPECTKLELRSFVDQVTAETFCSKYVSCLCGIAMGLKGSDKEAEVVTECDRARAWLTQDETQCRNDLLRTKELLNVLRAYNPNTAIPCTCQS